MLLALSLCLAATPADTSARFVLEVNSVPVAALTVSVSGDRYTYCAVHFLEEGDRNFEKTFSLSSLGAPPEVLALLTLPAQGCRDVVEERSGKREALCVLERQPGSARGTIAGEAFLATYEPSGGLRSIKVGAARWTRDETGPRRPVDNPFARGVAVQIGPLAITPAVSGSIWLTRAPTGIGTDQVGRTRCLVLARKAVAAVKGRRLAVGLVVEDGRAYPHAWVVEGDRALDPSVLPGDAVLRTRRYLEVPHAGSGAFFLALFDGQVTVVVPK
jgi:hypothetical protein